MIAPLKRLESVLRRLSRGHDALGAGRRRAPVCAPDVPLRGLLEVGRLVRAGVPPDELHRAATAAVAQALGFGVVVLNLVRPATDDTEVTVVHGNAAARDALLGTRSSRRQWDALLAPAFARGGAYLVTAGSFDWDTLGPDTWVPELERTERADRWDPLDALFVPLLANSGEMLGVLSVDEPLNGWRPGAAKCDALVAYAEHLAHAVEARALLDERERQRAALERLAEVAARVRVQDDLDTVADLLCHAASSSLQFREVQLAEVRDGRLAALAGVGPGRFLAELAATEALALLEASDPQEGCFLLRADAAPQAWGPALGQGSGARGWRAHSVFVPLT
ncbi:MAG: hypothetical protein H0U79_07490, partial [Solirubrobacterales bacterium]|nr:hypothetical protein [Solirubrobacterales bacterium]